MYRNFLESEKVQELLNSTKSPLAALTVLKKICDHPTLLQNYRVFSAALNGDDGANDSSDGGGDGDGGGSRSGGRDDAAHDPCASPQSRTQLVAPSITPARTTNFSASSYGGLITPARSLVRRAVVTGASATCNGDAHAHAMMSREHEVEPWGALTDAVVKESGKLQFTLELLQRLHHEKHRC